MTNLVNHDVTTFLDPLDLLAGPTDAEKIVTELAAIRKNISVDDVGNLAGSAVLDQYKAASAVITKKPFNLDSLLASDLPRAAGLLAAIALDVGIMGGAAKDLITSNIWLWPLGIGTLVYGVALGETHSDGSKIKHGFIVGATGAACILAAVTLSDNKDYVKHSGSLLPATWNSQSYDATTTLKAAKDKLQEDTKLRDDTNDLLNGNPAKGIVEINNDGDPHNDYRIPQLTADLSSQQTQVIADKTAIAKAETDITKAEASNPANRLARYIAAVTFAAPLFVSMLYFGHVLGRAPSRRREKAAAADRLKQYKNFVRTLEMPTSMRAKATQEATKMLQRFNAILTKAAKDDLQKLERVETLFTGAAYMEALDIAVDLICGSLTSEHDWKNTAPGLHARTAKWRKTRYDIEPESAAVHTPQGTEVPIAATDETVPKPVTESEIIFTPVDAKKSVPPAVAPASFANGKSNGHAPTGSSAGKGAAETNGGEGPTRPSGQVIVTFGEDGNIGIVNQLKHGPDKSAPSPAP